MTKVGSPNQYLNYEGCYDAVKRALGEAIWFIFGFGIVIAALVVS